MAKSQNQVSSNSTIMALMPPTTLEPVISLEDITGVPISLFEANWDNLCYKTDTRSFKDLFKDLSWYNDCKNNNDDFSFAIGSDMWFMGDVIE